MFFVLCFTVLPSDPEIQFEALRDDLEKGNRELEEALSLVYSEQESLKQGKER